MLGASRAAAHPDRVARPRAASFRDVLSLPPTARSRRARRARPAARRRHPEVRRTGRDREGRIRNRTVRARGALRRSDSPPVPCPSCAQPLTGKLCAERGERRPTGADLSLRRFYGEGRARTAAKAVLVTRGWAILVLSAYRRVLFFVAFASV